MGYKKGDWIILCNLRGDAKEISELNQYLGRCLPIIRLSNAEDGILVIVPINGKGIIYEYITNPNCKKTTDYQGLWYKDEVRLATQKEIKEAKLRLTAEAI